MLEGDFISDWINCGSLLSISSDKLILGWGKRKWLSAPDQSNPSFYFPDYFLQNATPWLVHQHYLQISIPQLLVYLTAISDLSGEKHVWRNPYRELFNKIFEELQKEIKDGLLKKAVPFVIESAKRSMDKVQLVKSLKRLLAYALDHPVSLYGFWGDREGMLGASPELLFKFDNQGLLKTMACAGTKNATQDSKAFLSDSKELYEHKLVIQGIKKALRPLGKVVIGKLQLLKLSQLVHLATPLSLQFSRALSFQEVVKILHPTPAVGAYPKKTGRYWLENYEKNIQRARFGAPVGYFFPEKGQSRCYVAIRNVQWNKDEMKIAAGCGVVAGSQVEKEWAEINLKLKTIKGMLDL